MSPKGKTNKNQTKAPKHISCSNRRGKEKEAAPGQSAKGTETDTPEAGNLGPRRLLCRMRRAGGEEAVSG